MIFVVSSVFVGIGEATIVDDLAVDALVEVVSGPDEGLIDGKVG